MPVSTATSDVLIGIAQHDPSALEGLFQARLDNLEASGLDPKSYALANIAALIALDAPPASYLFQIGFALDAGSPPRRSSACWWPSTRRSATSGSWRPPPRWPSPWTSTSTSKTAERGPTMIGRRRPLLRVAAIGGVAYMGSKAGAAKANQQAAQAQAAPDRLPHRLPPSHRPRWPSRHRTGSPS